MLSCEASSTAQDVMTSNPATYRQPTSSHDIFQTPQRCAPTSLAVARAQHFHRGSRLKRTSGGPRHIHAREVHSRGSWEGLLVSLPKPVAARRGQLAAFEGAALACSASAGRCMSQDWSRLEQDDLTLQLLRRWPSRSRDDPARVRGSTWLEARDGAGGECAQHRRRRRASTRCSWHQA